MTGPTGEQLAPAPGALNAEDAASFLGGAPITAKTMLLLARKKKIAHLKVGRARDNVVFPVEGLRAYIAAHTVEPEENPWGLTDQALATVRSARARSGAGRGAD